MSFNQTLSAVLRGHWLLDKAWAESHIPLVLSMLKGNPVSFVERTGNEETEQPFAIHPDTMVRYDLYRYDYNAGRYVPNPNIPAGSIGFLPVTGPITKYNGTCGEPGAILHATRLADLGKRENISAIIILMDTPGGEARAAHSFVTAIESVNKPVLAYVDDMAASLGMWITAACDEVYVSSKVARVGSIGSYLTLADWSGYFEQQGIKLHEIYAPQSEDKNKDYKEALKGNYEMIQAELKIHVDHFISHIETSRPQAAAHTKEWGTGKMFFPGDSQRIGLIDGVKTLQQVVSKAAWLGKRNKNL